MGESLNNVGKGVSSEGGNANSPAQFTTYLRELAAIPQGQVRSTSWPSEIKESKEDLLGSLRVEVKTAIKNLKRVQNPDHYHDAVKPTRGGGLKVMLNSGANNSGNTRWLLFNSKGALEGVFYIDTITVTERSGSFTSPAQEKGEYVLALTKLQALNYQF